MIVETYSDDGTANEEKVTPAVQKKVGERAVSPAFCIAVTPGVVIQPHGALRLQAHDCAELQRQDEGERGKRSAAAASPSWAPNDTGTYKSADCDFEPQEERGIGSAEMLQR
jgi:hypothetical protein